MPPDRRAPCWRRSTTPACVRQSPRGADAFQDTRFPERGQNATHQDNKTKKIHACPFHDESPDKM
jgi:hypothetical protein